MREGLFSYGNHIPKIKFISSCGSKMDLYRYYSNTTKNQFIAMCDSIRILHRNRK
uniref:Uncharacterized protein n=1 Tax=Arundo donax TaxID=35708 RepID=A0A0A9FJ94_ARUDO